MKRTTTVHLIDASPYIFRAFFSLPASMRDPEGRSVNAARGFADFLLRYFAEEAPTHVAVAFDESLTTSFRNELYPDYKAQRELPPAELEAQLKACQELARALGAAVFADERYEADDLIATLARPVTRSGGRVVVVTSDKDLAQLVSDRVEWFDFGKAVRLGASDVRAKFGVAPHQIPDFLGLAGDSVDNIPGVPGVGPKTAAALLSAFADLDELYSKLDAVAAVPVRGAAKLGAKLEQHRELAFLSKQLATVSTEAPAAATLDELEWRGADPRLVDPLFARLGFERIRERIPRWR